MYEVVVLLNIIYYNGETNFEEKILGEFATEEVAQNVADIVSLVRDEFYCGEPWIRPTK